MKEDEEVDVRMEFLGKSTSCIGDCSSGSVVCNRISFIGAKKNWMRKHET